MSRLRVDFHCRVIFMCLYTHVNFTRVNKIEARYEVLRLNVKLTKVQLLCLLGKTFHSFTLPQERIKGLYPLYFKCEHKFYERTHSKITRQWKSTLIQKR